MRILGNPPTRWLLAAIVSTGLMAALLLVRRLASTALQTLAAGTGSRAYGVAADLLGRTLIPFMVLASLYAGSFLLELGTWAETAARWMGLFLLLQIGVWAAAAMDSLLRQWHGANAPQGAAASILGFLGRTVVWSLVLMILLDNLGIRVTTLITGLGVGGIAVALAVQKVLGDLFASISIILDKPFEIGDFIQVGDLLGTVDHIGLKTTRVRSLSGEQLVFANSDLLDSRIHNYKRMYERRVIFTFAVAHRTPPDKLRAIPDWVKAAVALCPGVRFDRAHLLKFGESGPVYEVVFWIPSPDYNVYMDIQQVVNLDLAERFVREGVEFARPARTLEFEPAPRGT